MRKIILFIAVALLNYGCHMNVVESLKGGEETVKNFANRTADNVKNGVSLFTKPSRGFLIPAIMIEANSNFSSLLYDKTEAKMEDYKYAQYAEIDKERSYYVIPCKIESYDGVRYDDSLKSLITSILVMNKLGKIVNTPEDADIVVVTKVKESYQKTFGKNSAEIELSFFNKSNTPVMYAKVASVSNSDSNFYYYHSKAAKPVSYLTLKGVDYLISKSFERTYYGKRFFWES